VRLQTLQGLEHMGIVVDPARNEGRKKTETLISTDDSPIKVWVVPTNEELEIAREAVELAHAAQG
jgi:acetate kinase